jgi:hypothetical protein
MVLCVTDRQTGHICLPVNFLTVCFIYLSTLLLLLFHLAPIWNNRSTSPINRTHSSWIPTTCHPKNPLAGCFTCFSFVRNDWYVLPLKVERESGYDCSSCVWPPNIHNTTPLTFCVCFCWSVVVPLATSQLLCMSGGSCSLCALYAVLPFLLFFLVVL